MTRWLMVVAALLAVTPAQAQTSIVPIAPSKPPAQAQIPSDQSANYILPYCEDQIIGEGGASAPFTLLSSYSSRANTHVSQGALQNPKGDALWSAISPQGRSGCTSRSFLSHRKPSEMRGPASRRLTDTEAMLITSTPRRPVHVRQSVINGAPAATGPSLEDFADLRGRFLHWACGQYGQWD
jgi:hypothetical protein